jgi:hypothetical protein
MYIFLCVISLSTCFWEIIYTFRTEPMCRGKHTLDLYQTLLLVTALEDGSMSNESFTDYIELFVLVQLLANSHRIYWYSKNAEKMKRMRRVAEKRTVRNIYGVKKCMTIYMAYVAKKKKTKKCTISCLMTTTVTLYSGNTIFQEKQTNSIRHFSGPTKTLAEVWTLCPRLPFWVYGIHRKPRHISAYWLSNIHNLRVL